MAPREVAEGVRIDIWSDYVCPFCTLGERHLALALEDFPAREEVGITWRSFQLDPTAPKAPTGTAVDHLVDARGMSREQVEAMSEDLAQRAAEVGLEYNWPDIADHDQLRGFADQVGLGRGEVDRVLASTGYADAVAEEIALGRRIGVRGVPFFVFDGKFAVSGAQPVEIFTRALGQARPEGLK